MKYLLFSVVMLSAACTSHYKSLKPVPADPLCVEKMRPHGVSTSWFNASVDVVGKHISGLLLIKDMPDRSQRVVFTSETGLTFFDFEFKPGGDFQLRQAIPHLKKEAVIQTLRKDFEMLLAIPFRVQTFKAWATEETLYFGVENGKETHYFITDKNCMAFQRLETGSRRKPKITITLSGDDLQHPDAVEIRHHTFAMVINLTKLIRDAAE